MCHNLSIEESGSHIAIKTQISSVSGFCNRLSALSPASNLVWGGGAGFSFRASFPYMTAVSVLISSTCLGLKLEFPFPMWFIVSPTGFQGLLRRPCFAYRWPCLGAHRAFAWGCNCDPKPSPPWYDHCCLAAYLACALFTVSHHIWRSFPYLPPGDASDRGWSPCTLEYYNPSTRNCILCGIKGVL